MKTFLIWFSLLTLFLLRDQWRLKQSIVLLDYDQVCFNLFLLLTCYHWLIVRRAKSFHYLFSTWLIEFSWWDAYLTDLKVFLRTFFIWYLATLLLTLDSSFLRLRLLKCCETFLLLLWLDDLSVFAFSSSASLALFITILRYITLLFKSSQFVFCASDQRLAHICSRFLLVSLLLSLLSSYNARNELFIENQSQ